MGDRYLTDLAVVLRAAGLTVIELDGWSTRARGSGGYDPGRPTHVMVHHTASPPSSSGRPDAEYCAWGDEDAPLSNLCLDRGGAWWVLAAGATNTNGKGGPLDGVPADSMNTYAIGVEANGGYGEAWPAVQTDAYVAGVAVLCDHYGLDHVRAHFEWAPDRKIDPAGPSPWAEGDNSWDMGAFRVAVGSSSGSGPAPPTPGPGPSIEDDVIWRVAKLEGGAYYIGDGTTAYTVGDAGHDVTMDESLLRMAPGAVNAKRVAGDGATDGGAGPPMVTSWGEIKSTWGPDNLRRHVGDHPSLR